MLKLKYKVKFLALVAALPAALIVASPVLNSERSVASLNQFRNWGLENTVGNSHIHAVDAWKLEEGSRDVVVAVVDTGLDANHPDIKANLWHEKGTNNYGYDFVAGKPNPIDDHSHGTHVAGILGAALNAKAGISGVAHKVSIMAVKYYSEKNTGAENLRNSIKALNWAIDHGAHIINYSGGGPEFSGEEYAALKRARDKGILLVAAAGNERQNSDLPENYYYPCAYRLENIICVAAINIHNDMLPSSNWGKVRVDVAAPGENILSTVPGAKYSYMSGTSQATAFVTGEAALLLSKNSKLRPDQIRDIIRANVDPLPSLKDKVFSGGKVNAYAALASLDRAGRAAQTVVSLKPEPRLEALSKTSSQSGRRIMNKASASKKSKHAVAAKHKKASSSAKKES
ncbi:MAG: S8 family serine peptidase [Deltaproteobacteria bacterium]|nr:S8 family serine peptidase [Deltaproteobacteria bacterium]